MLGLHLVWSLWLARESILVQDAREGVERLIKALENRQNTMECLHGLPASSTVTQKRARIDQTAYVHPVTYTIAALGLVKQRTYIP